MRIQGSGVNPDRYPRQPLPPPDRQITFTMVARLMVEKGVREFAEAACRINPEAWLVNVSRGGVVDDTALLKSLRRGALAGAVLDVFEREPLDAGHPYWAMPNVLVTPHVSGTSDRYMQRAMEVFRRNLRQLEETGCLATPVDIRLGY